MSLSHPLFVRVSESDTFIFIHLCVGSEVIKVDVDLEDRGLNNQGPGLFYTV